MLKKIAGGVTAPQGFTAAGVKAGIKKSGNHDVAVITSSVPAAAAGVFTLNTMAAAPVAVSRRVADRGKALAIVINSGCANACTGAEGLANAEKMAEWAAASLKCAASEVFVASTGIIGVNLPMEKIHSGIEQAVKELSSGGGDNAMQAIMTTDTFPKVCAYEFELGGVKVRLGGMAKGAGMIHPNMATMLACLTTDAAVEPTVLRAALKEAVDVSFNMISVDGDTSTNDSVMMLANGMAKNPVLESLQGEDYQKFVGALKTVGIELAKLVAKDGEGATKLLEVQVKGAVNFVEAKQAAMAIAKSPLVKTAFFGEDPNWGRILCAVGYSGSHADPAKVSLHIGDVAIVKGGQGLTVDEKVLEEIMAPKEIAMVVDLAVGDGEATVWTCDFSYDYVKINGDYHT